MKVLLGQIDDGAGQVVTTVAVDGDVDPGDEQRNEASRAASMKRAGAFLVSSGGRI